MVNCNMVTPLVGRAGISWLFLFLLIWLLQTDKQCKEKAPQLIFHMLCSAWIFGISDLNSVWFGFYSWLCFLLDYGSLFQISAGWRYTVFMMQLPVFAKYVELIKHANLT